MVCVFAVQRLYRLPVGVPVVIYRPIVNGWLVVCFPFAFFWMSCRGPKLVARVLWCFPWCVVLSCELGGQAKTNKQTNTDPWQHQANPPPPRVVIVFQFWVFFFGILWHKMVLKAPFQVSWANPSSHQQPWWQVFSPCLTHRYPCCFFFFFCFFFTKTRPAFLNCCTARLVQWAAFAPGNLCMRDFFAPCMLSESTLLTTQCKALSGSGLTSCNRHTTVWGTVALWQRQNTCTNLF